MDNSEDGFICGWCGATVGAKWDEMARMYIPVSLYWKGARDRVEVPFCSPECSLSWKIATSNIDDVDINDLIDPNFTGGLSAEEYLKKFRAGELER